jgi:cobalt/nickel transport system permease protein
MKSTVFDIHTLDTLSRQDSAVHRIDARIKLVVTAAFIVTVMSAGRYAVLALIPFFMYPVALTSAGGLSFAYLFKRTLAVSPFAVMVGIFNPFFDKAPLITIGGIAVSGGWLSFVSILLRFFLTVEAALILIAVTGIYGIGKGLRQCGVPQVLTTQLLLLYRYLFVLIEESARMIRARELRTFTRRQKGIRLFARLVGSLLLRTYDRSLRIHQAMSSRGFEGEIRMSCNTRIKAVDMFFCIVCIAFFVLIRTFNITEIFGKILVRLFV